MPTIVFIRPDGSPQVCKAEVGLSAMQVAVNNSVPGIDADCGGACACATCHVYVQQAWLKVLPEVGTMEADLLECAHAPNDFSRLACQIRVTDDTEGLVLRVPEQQV